MKSFCNPAYLTESTGLEIWAKVKILLRQLQLNKSLEHHQAQAGNPQPKAKKKSNWLVTEQWQRFPAFLFLIFKYKWKGIYFSTGPCQAWATGPVKKGSQGRENPWVSGIFCNHMDIGGCWAPPPAKIHNKSLSQEAYPLWGEVTWTGTGERGRKSENIHVLRDQKEMIWRAIMGTCRNSWTSEALLLLFLLSLPKCFEAGRTGEIWRQFLLFKCT